MKIMWVAHVYMAHIGGRGIIMSDGWWDKKNR